MRQKATDGTKISIFQPAGAFMMLSVGEARDPDGMRTSVRMNRQGHSSYTYLFISRQAGFNMDNSSQVNWRENVWEINMEYRTYSADLEGASRVYRLIGKDAQGNKIYDFIGGETKIEDMRKRAQGLAARIKELHECKINLTPNHVKDDLHAAGDQQIIAKFGRRRVSYEQQRVKDKGRK